MTTETQTLAGFLLARIAEDEADAREAYYDGQRWVPEEEAVVAADRELDPVLFLDRKSDAQHAANWSPARVLADCEAKRRIVELHPAVRPEVSAAYNPDDMVCGGCTIQVGNGLRFPRREMHLPFPCPTLRALALPYAGHPDYREEWRL